MIRRREFITLLGGTAAAWPLAARGQQGERMRRIGMLMGVAEGDTEGERWVQAFLQAMQSLGWRRGTNVQIEIRWGASNLDRMRTFAKELVSLQPDLIQVTTTPATAAVIRETRTIPIVFSIVSDPVGSGFVTNLAQPGGNVTGFINVEASLGSKWVELLMEMAPRVSRAAMLFNPATAPQTAYYRSSIENASRTLGIAIEGAPFQGAADIEKIIPALGQNSDGGLIVMPDISNQTHRETIISLTARHRVPAVYGFQFFVKDGGLASYGVDLPDLQRRAATYADRILKGAKPADLPVQLPTKFELAINLKSAKALGLEIPPSLLARADEVIE
jgi:putative ABC transport system substrate-binding protein